ncbi:unnamed protein product [Calicophoron daubneyi]|uniref:Tetraspanin n=1 Tax=Calicophoron daubneyi TaxID=300641 RepID=A0AAV2TTH6_CALDB
MEDTSGLTYRLSVLKGLHAWFIVTLLCTGLCGVGFFSYSVNTPIRVCPVVSGIYAIYWLSLAISIFQAVLGLIFLSWFLIAICTSRQPNYTVDNACISPPAYSDRTAVAPRPVLDALGLYGTSIGARGRENVQIITASSLLMKDNSHSRRGCCHRRPRIGWLGLSGIFLAILSAGHILSLVLTVNQLYLMHTNFEQEITNIFVEAYINLGSVSRGEKIPNHALHCWQTIQSCLKCCGLKDYTDWTDQNDTQPIPDSCYCSASGYGACGDSYPITSTDGRLIYSAGCLTPTHRFFGLQLLGARLFLAVTLGFILLTFFVDLGYTLYVAYVSLYYPAYRSDVGICTSAPSHQGSSRNRAFEPSADGENMSKK